MLDCFTNIGDIKRDGLLSDHRVLFILRNLLDSVAISSQSYQFVSNRIRAPPSSLIFNF